MMMTLRIEMIFPAISWMRNVICKKMTICKRKLQNHLVNLVLQFIRGYCYNYLLFTDESNEEVKIIAHFPSCWSWQERGADFALRFSSVSHWVVGCTVVIKCMCEMGHTFVWASSPIICNAGNSEMFKNNLVFAASILLSGNNFYNSAKFPTLAAFHPQRISCINDWLCAPLLSSFMNSHRYSFALLWTKMYFF